MALSRPIQLAAECGLRRSLGLSAEASSQNPRHLALTDGAFPGTPLKASSLSLSGPSRSHTPQPAPLRSAVRPAASSAPSPSPFSSSSTPSAPKTSSRATAKPPSPRASVAPLVAEEDPTEQKAPVNGTPQASAASVLAPPTAPKSSKTGNGSARSQVAAPPENGAATSSSQAEGLGIMEFLKGKNILVTGATGFLAKILVEKILREQPDVGRLYLVIQPKSDASAEQRLASQVSGSQIFQQLREKYGEKYEEFMTSKLVATEGNLCREGLDFSAGTSQMLKENIDVIVNSAATTTFDERYDFALNLNTLGPKRIMEFAKECPKLQIFVHVSTAFVNGQREGWTAERPFVDGDSIAKELGGPGAVREDLSVEAELALSARELEKVQQEAKAAAQASGEGEEAVAAAVQKHMVELGMRRAQQYGWQDTYVFTKAMGEMLVSRYLKTSKFPVAVVRPSIVESSMQEPMRGWMEGLRMADPILLAYGKGQMSGFLADPKGVLDMVPADFVINALLAIMASGAKREPGTQVVYHVATSVANPLGIQLVADATSDHFAEEPMLLPREGEAIRVQRMKVFQIPFLFFLDVWTKYQLPLQLARLMPTAKGSLSEKRTNLMLKTAQQLSYLAKIYAPYTFYSCRFDATNTQALLPQMSQEEKRLFPFDLTKIDWHHYLCHTHLPGLRKYVLKGRGSRDA